MGRGCLARYRRGVCINVDRKCERMIPSTNLSSTRPPFIHLLAEAARIATRKCIKAIVPAAKVEAGGDYGPLIVLMIPAVGAVLNLEMKSFIQGR